MKVVAIIQARMGSTRLPGKVLMEVLDKPLLEYQIERVKRSKLIDEVVIATTTKETETPIIDLCKRLGIFYYRGSENNVLKRYYEAATQYNADIIVRLTSDCPIIDPQIIDMVINSFIENREEIDYASNTLERTYPRGMDVEVFSYKALKYTYLNATSVAEQEHVTPYIYQNPNTFNLFSIINDLDESKHRWTVDTIEDFNLIKKIICYFNKHNTIFSINDVINLLNNNKEWSKINSNVIQKDI